jgi:hypothetical protein
VTSGAFSATNCDSASRKGMMETSRTSGAVRTGQTQGRPRMQIVLSSKSSRLSKENPGAVIDQGRKPRL